MTTWPDSPDVACRPGAVLGFARGSEEGTPLTPAPPSWLKWFGLEHAVPLLANVVLALALSWPLVRDFTTLFAGNIVADQVHAIWISWNVKQWLFGNAPLFTAPLLYYPVGSSLLLDGVGPVSGLLTLPFWGWGVVAAYNGAVILGLALSGYAMYLLARALDFTRGVALLAAVVLQLTPSHVAGLYGHLEKILIALPALVLLGLYRAFKEQGQWWWWALVTAMTWLLVGLHSGYLFAHTIVAVVFFVVVAVLGAKGESRRQATRRAAVLAALSAVILGPFLVAVVRVAADPAFLVRLNTMSGYYAPDVTQLFIPPSYNAMFGWLNTRFAWLASRPRAGMDIDVETAVALSWTACLLAVCALASRDRRVWPWAAFTALFVVLSLGPFLRLFGYERFTDFKLPIILPYAVLDSFPGFAFMRCSGRFMMVGAIGLSVLACFGVTRLQTLFPRWRGLVVIVAIAFVLVEGWPKAWPQWSPAQLFPPSRFHTEMARDTDTYGVLDLPVSWPPGSGDVRYMWYQLWHGKGIAWGYLSRPYRAHPIRLVRRLIEGGRTEAGQSGSDSGAFATAQAELSQLGYRYVIWHKTQTDMKGAVPTQEFIDGAWGKSARPHFEDEMIRVYQIRSPSAVETPTEPDTVEANGSLQVTVERVDADGRDIPVPSTMAKERDRNLLGRAIGAPEKRNSLRPAPPLLGDVHAAFRDSEGRVPTDLELEEPEVVRGKVDGEGQRWLVTRDLDQPRGKTRGDGRIVSRHEVSDQDGAVGEGESADDDQRGG
jgi:hypothetical protein